jgi:membrane-associated phospholipid phosphatase
MQVGPPLMNAQVRRGAGVLLVSCAIVVGVLGILFAHQTRADGFDNAVDSPVITWFAGHPGLGFRLASPGSMIPAALLSAAVVVACLVAGRLNGALLASLAMPVAVGLDERVLKPLFDRTYLGSLAYPSGHTTAMSAIAATITLLLLVPAPGRATALRFVVAAAAWVLAVVVATAVIGVRWHYVTDTWGGAAVGIGTVCGIALVLDRRTVRAWLTRAARGATRAGA